MKNAAALASALLSLAAVAAEDLKVTADYIAADRRTGALVASGRVNAVSHPYRLVSERLVRDADMRYTLSDPTTVTTCTNDLCDLHWSMTGAAEYSSGRSVELENVWLRLWGVPVMWLPWWYYPLDTDYGLRMMPGYTSRWGAYLLTKYVYHLAGDHSHAEGSYWLRGATRMDLRWKNGVALGQSLAWQLGDYGKGWFKTYYAWDENHGRYDRHWRDTRHWNYGNWGSEVPYDRYSVELGHRWEVTERDVLRARGTVYSDSHFRRDFLRDGVFGWRNAFGGYSGNEVAWERNDGPVGAGVSASGPMNRFIEGVERLPEAYFDVVPYPLWGLPATYESQSRAGYLNRRAAVYGTSSTAEPFRHNPGPWADFNTFRFDTYHRVSASFKAADVVSIVPRVGFRGTWWGDSGYTSIDGRDRAGSTGDDMARLIAEGGVTFAARGEAWIGDGWQHVAEPYSDVLLQEAAFSGDGQGKRPYVFDSLDGSRDWLDQFAGRSRNLPYSWYGVTPGFRNVFRKADDSGRLKTVLDVDAYAAVQFNDGEWTEGGRYHRLAKPGEPNYGRHAPMAVPGMRIRWRPDADTSLSARAEYDSENERLAYASARLSHRLDRRFSWRVEFMHRDQRWWDYSSSAYDRALLRGEDFNLAQYGCAEVGFEHELCDAIAWAPYIRWDCREGELDEIGSWFDYRTDCLGFRLAVGYENGYTRVDWSKHDHDWHVGFYVYLRAFGPDWGDVFRE